MELQKTYSRKYAEILRNDISANLDRYASPVFGTEEEQILYVPHLEHPVGLCERMLKTKTDAEAAKLLYESYRLTPLQASQNAFWVYLTHTELFPYVQKRWNKVLQKGDNKQYILYHWFYSHGMIGNALAGLWWSVHCTIDRDSDYPYKYTDFYLSNYTLRVVRLGPSKLFRHKEAVFGIIDYLLETRNWEASNGMEDRVNFVVSYFNKMGATKQLASCDRKFFYDELSKVSDSLLTFHHKKTAEEQQVENEDSPNA